MLEDIPDEPQVPRHRRFVWDSFWRLAADRAADLLMVPMPMGGSTIQRIPKPISTLAVHDWCRTYGLDVDETEAFRRLIDAMDAVAVEHLSKAAQAPSPPSDVTANVR